MSAVVPIDFVYDEEQPDGVYTGRLVDNERDGRGTLMWQEPDGQHTYDGMWSDNFPNGRGVYTWPDGTTYDGEWQNGDQDGWGVWDGGPYYGWFEGLWRSGYCSKGTWHHRNAVDVLEGEWVWDDAAKCHNLQGLGVWRKRITKGDKAVVVTVYEGEWNNGQSHGNGTWRAQDTGTIYCGEWVHGAMCGTGRMLIGDNRSHLSDQGGSYVGEMKNHKFHGEGVRVWANGDRYQGNWEDGMEHGPGTKRWDGSSFTGVWERGVPVNGTMEWPNGDKFTGIFTEQRDGETRIYHGEGVLSPSSLSLSSLLPLSSGDGSCLMTGGENSQLKGSLRGNTFHGVDGAALHVMGSSLPWWHHSQLIKELETKQIEEDEGDGLLHNGCANETDQQQTRSEALCELSTAFRVTTRLRSQLKKAAPLLVSLEQSVSALKQILESTAKSNQSLDVHLRNLSNLRETLEKVVEGSDRRRKEILGQTLTVESSEPEIQQCFRNISSLTKKLLGIKPLLSGNKEEQGTLAVPSQEPNAHTDINNIMTLKPWLLLKSLEPPPPSTNPFPLLLRELTDTVVLLTHRGSNDFDNCLKVIEQHTVLYKECSTQAALGQRLHKEIDDLLSTCQGLKEAHKCKYMVMRGLEGEEQFMTHPDVWSQLSELLPHAQQSVMDVMVSKCTSTTPGINPTMSLQPGFTASVAAQSHSGCHDNQQDQQQQWMSSSTPTGGTVMMCIECDERPSNVQLQPCGHLVLCSQCAAAVRKCPHCRVVIRTKIQIP
ncbi:Phosphatidylinositol 4-phosphate 5-kinase 4 [Pelomyxa schiedti]|nr:Phosphatidylinositol 4-phosphate 5-kinase 4 [Pelomyxa schiedti]